VSVVFVFFMPFLFDSHVADFKSSELRWLPKESFNECADQRPGFHVDEARPLAIVFL